MKWLKLVGVGVIMWSLSLVWPEINRVLTPAIMQSLALTISGAILLYVSIQYLLQNHSNGDSRPKHHQPAKPEHQSRPVSITSA